MYVSQVSDARVVARVDYRSCDHCGFRLMRVETTILDRQHMTTWFCPICKHSSDQPSGALILSDNEIQHRFDSWLHTHGLTRKTLEKHYHLVVDNFFDPDIR